MSTLAYPETRYPAVTLPDLGSPVERKRLSPSALRTFFRIMETWKIRDEHARALLGGMANGPYYAMKKNPGTRVLSNDTLLRISYLLGIFKALSILHGEALADEWIGLTNENPIFGGTSPLTYMVKGGIPAMQTVRRLLDARRGEA
jgi:hypothetical protein